LKGNKFVTFGYGKSEEKCPKKIAQKEIPLKINISFEELLKIAASKHDCAIAEQ
jgi:hypothetical protein